MITLVIVTNPFSPQDGRFVSQVEYDGTLGELLKENTVDGVEMQATVNGYSVDNDYQIKNDDFVVIYPVVAKGGKGGKGILGIIAAVALSVVSFGIASGGWLAGIGIKAGTFAAYAAATAVMFLGSSLIGRMTGQKIDTGGFDGENEPTYSWGGVQTMEGQNNAISLTYGKVKSGGQTIGKFVSAKDNEEYLNWLIAAGEGPLTITDIKLNDNAIGNYSNVTCEIRPGTNDQKTIPYFNDTYFTKSLSYHMTTLNQWYTDTAQGTATEGLIFKIEFPNGLFHGTDSGKFATNYVEIEMRYKLHSSTEWQYYSGEAVRIEGDTNKAIRKEFRVDNIPAGSYDVGVRVIYQDYKDATRDQKECYWVGITSIVYDDFIYPCQALIGIQAKATDQLNGSPSLTFMKERQNVWVYNPHSESYEQHRANNPAWACYDLLHQARQLKNVNTNTMEMEVRGAAKELMRYDDFAEWAAWCDEKEYFVNIEINTVGELLEIANQKIAPIGHGLVVRFGTRYGCIYNHVQTPVQMFGMGNIIEGSFSEDFLKVSDRANCVEITFTNKDAGYEREVITIYGDTYDSDGYAKTAQMTFDGITDYKQAYREGMYQLYSNRYLLRTVTFTAGIDSIACTVGDVIMVSHDVPRWANSGRIESIDGATWVLPIELEDLTKSYRIQWRTQKDNLYTRACEVVSSADGWTTITVTGTIPSNDAPQVGDVFDIAVANIGSKPFVVKSITRSQDFERTISCLEYNENIYDENYDIPVIDYSQWYGEPQNVTGLIANISQTKNEFGENIGRLRCSWNMPDKGDRFTVLLSTDGTTWTIGKSNVTGNVCELDVLPNTTYWVKVVTLLGVNQSSGTVAGPLYPNGDNNLPNVTNLQGYTRYRGVKSGEYRYDIHLTWTPPKLTNYQNCDIWYKTNHRQAKHVVMTKDVPINAIGFENAWQYIGNGISDFVLSDVVYGDIYRFAVCTRDSAGNSNDPDNAPTVDVVTTAKTTIPNTPNKFSITFGKNSVATWEEVSNADIQYYEVRTDVHYGEETEYLLARTTGRSATLPLTQRSGTLYLYAKSLIGKYSAPAILEYNKPAPPTPNAPTLTNKLGGFALVAGAIPGGCNGMNIYIDGVSLVSVHTVNNTYTHTCDAGIYDVQVAYTDIFGEGAKSAVSRVTVKATVDSSLLESQAVTKAKLETSIQNAVDDAVQSAQDIVGIKSDITSINGDITNINDDITSIDRDIADISTDLASVESTANGIVTELNKTPAQSSYNSIAGLKTITDNIISDATTNYNALSGRITANTTDIQQNESDITALASRTDDTEDDIAALQVRADGIAATVASNKTTQDAWNSSTSSSISTIQQNATSLATTVANNKTTQDGINSSVASQITQNADSITAITTKLGSAPDATGQYAAIVQLKQSVTGLETQVEEIYEMTDEGIAPDIATMKSQIQQNSRSIETVVSNLNASASGNTYTSISSLSQRADSIASTVSSNKTAQDSINAGTSSSGLKTLIETNASNITQTANGVSAIVAKLNSATDILDYDGVSALSDEIAAVDLKADGISTTVTNNKTAQDAINAGTSASGLKSLIDTNTTNISQNASSITSLASRVTTTENQLGGKTTSGLKTAIQQNATDITSVATRVTATESQLAGTTTSALQTAINQNASGITSVASRVTTTESQLDGTATSTLLTRINQNASGISAVVADVADVADDVADIEDNLNDSTKARSYTAIQVMQDGIASKCTLGEATSYFQQDHTGFYIKGSLINIDGDTIIGNNVITRNAIASNAINASKIAAGAVTAAKMSVDSLSAITATIGTLRTATTGARTEIKDNLIEVYDSNGTLRVRMGVWT